MPLGPSNPIPPAPPAILNAYHASFVTPTGTASFDVRMDGYASTVEGNRTVRTIPWSQTYSVVIQRGGLNPHTRRYRAFVYSEPDFLALALLVNVPNGVLTTPREPNGTNANLDSISRGDILDPLNAAGPTAVDLNFTMLA